MALFPLLVGVGFFAPGWVQHLATAQEEELGPRGPLVDRIGPFARRPLPASRRFFGGAAPELLDLDQLLDGVGDGKELPDDLLRRLASFPRSAVDNIVLNDVGRAAQTIAFKDILTDPRYSSPKLFGDIAGNLGGGPVPICATAPYGNCVRFDDFTGVDDPTESDPVPEPATGLMLGLGLLWLARRHPRA